MIMVTKFNRENLRPFDPTADQAEKIRRDSMNAWTFEPQVLDDDTKGAYLRELNEELAPDVPPARPMEWVFYLLLVLCWVVVGWHFVAKYMSGAPL